MNHQNVARSIAMSVVEKLSFTVTSRSIQTAMNELDIPPHALGTTPDQIRTTLHLIRDEIFRVLEHELFPDSEIDKITHAMGKTQDSRPVPTMATAR